MTKLLNCPTLYKIRAKYYKVHSVCLHVCVGACLYVCVCFPLWAGSVWSETFLFCQTSCVENRREMAYVYIMYDVYFCVCRRKLL